PTPTPRHATGETPTARAESGEIQLPQPNTKGSMSLEETLLRRRSVRMYRQGPLSLQDIAQLFWAAQGVTVSWGGRTAPSAGALYPLEIYAATANGVYHYLPREHRARITMPEDIRQALWAAGLYQESLVQAPVIFVITAIYRRTEIKYGDRAERYVKLEAGHAAQNLLLQAVALNLGAVVIGAFYDEAVASALHLPDTEKAIYLIPVGHLVE
ncbi:MAG: SagB/ThcOx family dehydrogenase, partial [Anaerolineae bacterium]